MCESPCGVASAGANEAARTMVVHALNGGNRFHVFETPRGAEATPLGPVAMERDPEIAEAKGFTKRCRTVRDGARHVPVRLGNR